MPSLVLIIKIDREFHFMRDPEIAVDKLSFHLYEGAIYIIPVNYNVVFGRRVSRLYFTVGKGDLGYFI